MNNRISGTDHITAQFEQRLRFRGESAAGAIDTLRSLRSGAPETMHPGPMDERRNSPAGPIQEKTSGMKNILKAIGAALFATGASATKIARTAVLNAPGNPSGHAG